jgi:large subunit ribosomal protein L1
MGRHGRKFLETRARVDREREYQPAEAVALVKELKRAGFDESVEVHVRTGLNVRHADEQLRGTIALPNGLGKEVKIAVFAQGDKAREAEEAGADVVGGEDLAKRVQEGFTDFDVAIATPDMMPVVGRLGRILGPQGKMPNPKVGTVTPDIRRAVEESKAARSSTAPTARRSCTSSSARPLRGPRAPRELRGGHGRDHPREGRRRPRAATSGR